MMILAKEHMARTHIQLLNMNLSELYSRKFYLKFLLFHLKGYYYSFKFKFQLIFSCQKWHSICIIHMEYIITWKYHWLNRNNFVCNHLWKYLLNHWKNNFRIKHQNNSTKNYGLMSSFLKNQFFTHDSFQAQKYSE